MHTAAYWIEKLGLTGHIEGGFFRETYRSPLVLPADGLPVAFGAGRNSCTGIYFLLEQGGYSAFHRIKSDELWHFYTGDPLLVYAIDPAGNLTEHHLGNDPEQGEHFQALIPAGHWFAARVKGKGAWSLAGCTVSPGFDFADFELAVAEELVKQFPQYEALIRQLT